MTTTREMALDGRLREIVHAAAAGAYPVEEAVLRLRGEVLLAYIKGRQAAVAPERKTARPEPHRNTYIR